MAFNVYTSNRLERLADRLAGRVVLSPPAPLEKETLVVMSVGMGRWISQQMSQRLRVWANYEYLFPTAMVERIFEAFSGGARLAKLNREVLSWRVYSLLPEYLGLKEYAPLAAYMGNIKNELKLRQLSVRIAGIFDQYVVHRPEMVLDWEAGRDPKEAGDELWQADLWRRLAAGGEAAHQAALASRFFKEINTPSQKRPAGLPSRISLFGIATLPPLYVRLLYALSRHIDVDFYVLDPSRYYWGDILSEKEQSRITRRMKPGSSQELAHLDRGNPLLASMGRVGRDFLFSVLLEADESVDFIDDFPKECPSAKTLLGMVQEDILELADRGDGARRAIEPGDLSISIHSCHSPMREVEVLRNYLLDLFDGVSDVKPHDVVVMTPDIEIYGPLFEAVFGASGDDEPRIPYSIADRSLSEGSASGRAFFAILDLCGGRFTASQVLDIMECDRVLSRFDLGPSDRDLIRNWVDGTSIRWGIDAEHRAELPERLPATEENTWRHGMDRMLLGSAMCLEGEGLFEGILPYDMIEGSYTAVLGRFVDLLEALFEASRSLSGPRTPLDWAEHLLSLIERFFEGDEQADELTSLRGTVSRLAREAGAAGFSGTMGFPVMRSWLEDAVREERAHGVFLSGGVTFCAMLPMRSIPFRVICMVGMNDGSYPRRDIEAGFNLMKKEYRPGDRSRRNDDRYIFLEALISARDRLFISYVGQNITDNKPMPPSVLVSELLDYIEQAYRAPDNEPLRPLLLTVHRLQAFSPAYFSGDSKLYSYASELCAAAGSFGEAVEEYKPFMTGEAGAVNLEDDLIRLEDLISFFRNPARYFLNQTLKIKLDLPAEALNDTEIFSIGTLDSYLIKSRLLEAILEGREREALYRTLRAEGRLPHGAPGEMAFKELVSAIDSFAAEIKRIQNGAKLSPLDIRIEVDGYTIAGRIDGVFPGGLVRYRPGNIREIDRLSTWIEYSAAVCAAGTEEKPVAYLIGADNKTGHEIYKMSDSGECRKHLGELLKIYLKGRRSLVPFFPKSSFAFAEEYGKNRSADKAIDKAAGEYVNYKKSRPDGADLYIERCYHKLDPFAPGAVREQFIELSRAVYGPVIKYQEKA